MNFYKFTALLASIFSVTLKINIDRYYTEESYNDVICLNSVENKLFNNVNIKYSVYFIYQNNELVYIGKSTNTGKCIYSHKVTKFKKVDCIDVYTFKSIQDIHYLEPYLIAIHKPKYNIDHKELSVPSINIDWRKAIKNKYKVLFNY